MSVYSGVPDRRRVVIKNIRPGCLQETLENYMEVTCGIEVEDVSYFEDFKKIAMVTSKEDIPDFQKSRKAVSERKLEKNEMELVEVIKPCGVIVWDIPDISEDGLTFYFEKKTSGGQNECVVDCKIYKNLEMAVVKFINHQVAQNVLNVKNHKPSKGQRVRLEPYYAAFHEDILQHLQSQTELHSSHASRCSPITMDRNTSPDHDSHVGGSPPISTKKFTSPDQNVEVQERMSSRIQMWENQTKELSSPSFPSRSFHHFVSEDHTKGEDGVEFISYDPDISSASDEEVDSCAEVDPDEVYFSLNVNSRVSSARPSPSPDSSPERPNFQPFVAMESKEVDVEILMKKENSELQTSDVHQYESVMSFSGQSANENAMCYEEDTYHSLSDSESSFSQPHAESFKPSGSFENFLLEPSQDWKTSQRQTLQPAPEPQSIPVPRPAPKPRLDPKPQPAPKPQLEPKPWPAPEPQPAPTSEPGSKPDPKQSFSRTEKQVHKTAEVKLKPFEVKLLALSGIERQQEHENIVFSFDADQGIIKMKGPEENLQTAKLRVYEEKQGIEFVTVSIPKTVVQLLISPAGEEYINKTIKGSKTAACYVADGMFHCAAFSQDDTKTITLRMQKAIQQQYLSYDQTHVHCVGQAAWQELIKQLEAKYLVQIVCETLKKSICIDGLNGDADRVKREIEKHLKQNSHKSGSFRLTGAKARCLISNFQKEIASIKEMIRSGGGQFKDMQNEDSFEITFTGEVTAIKSVETTLTEVAKQIWHEKVILNRDVAKEKDLELLVSGLRRSNLKTYQASFMAQHSCFLDLHLSPSTTKTGPRYAMPAGPRLMKTESMPVLDDTLLLEEIRPFHDLPTYRPSVVSTPQPSNTLTVGGTTISVKKGDITKVKADVLVNVVSTTLDIRQTAVSIAFMNAGGPSFCQEFEERKSDIDGDIIVTKGTGNLGCKYVYSIVLDKWDGQSSKSDLKTAMNDCLTMAANHHVQSIAFPSVGCGLLFQFPSKTVASCLVSAAKLGKIKTVTFVIYDDPTYQTFLQEINPGLSSGHRDLYEVKSRDMVLPHFSRKLSSSLSSGSSDTLTVGTTKLHVKKGNLAQGKADVMVNVVSSNLDLSQTAVSQALLQAGGLAFSQAFEIAKSTKANGNIIVCQGGNLNCSYMFNIILSKWSHANPGKSKQELKTAIADCFSLAIQHKASSIAFPSVGCGMLFKFPPPFVASVLISSAKQVAGSSGKGILKNVDFVIFDFPGYQTFLHELNPARVESAMSSNSDEDEAEDHKVLRDLAKSTRTVRKPSEDVKSAYIQVFAKCKAVCEKAKKELIKQLKTDFLHREEVENENLTRLPRNVLYDIKKMGEKSGIFIKFPDPENKKKSKPQLKLKGEKSAVQQAKIRIVETLLEEVDKNKRGSVPSVKAKRGSVTFLQEMGIATVFNPPGYWTYFKKDKSAIDSVKSFLGLTATSKNKWELVDVKAGSSIFVAIDSVVQKTWRADIIGHGQDAVNLKHKGIKITQIQRLEHPELFKRYCQRRAVKFMKAYDFGSKPFTAVAKLPNSKGDVKTTQFATTDLKQDVFQEVNEHYFFHGTKKGYITAILENGLDFRIGNSQAMFGAGIYGAESSTKADQYADDKTARSPPGTSLQMVLMRMTLGSAYLCSDPNPKKYRKPPCTNMTCLKDNCTYHKEFFDSIIGDGKWLFREFVVYEQDLCYPEYIITYQRV